jgi:hypothetical protein
VSVFDLDEDGNTAIAEQVQALGVAADDVQPGFFEGGLTGTGMGFARGFSKLGRAGALAVGAGLTAAEKLGGYEQGEIADSYFDTAIKLTDESVEFFTPRATEVGTAGRVLGGLAEIVAPLAAGGGNPALLIGSTGLNTTYDLAQQGVDPTTATTVGLVDATAVGIGFRLPFLGSTFAKKAATGAAGSLALGIGATAADREILESGGYPELSQLYNPLDLEARTVDILTGIAFGGLAQLQASGRAPEIARSDRDAALTALNAKHFQNDTAPGRPADEGALIAHQSALEQAIRDLQEGRPVDVSESRVTEAKFLDPRETSSTREPDVIRLTEAVERVLDDLGIKGLKSERAEADAAEPTAEATLRLKPPVLTDVVVRKPPVLTDVVARKPPVLNEAVETPAGERRFMTREDAFSATRPIDAIVDTPAALGEAPRGDALAPGRTVTAAAADAAPVLTPGAKDGTPVPPRADAEPARQQSERAEIDDPDVIAAERSLLERDIEIEAGDLDADGAARTASARESLAAARQEVQAAKQEATAFEAAVACALSFGDA